MKNTYNKIILKVDYLILIFYFYLMREELMEELIRPITVATCKQNSGTTTMTPLFNLRDFPIVTPTETIGESPFISLTHKHTKTHTLKILTSHFAKISGL